MNTLLTILISAAVSLGSVFGVHLFQTPQTPTPQAPALGAFNPTGGGTYRLQSSIGGSATSLTLSSFKEPISGIKYTMSYLNSSIEYATIEPQSSNKEFVSFTGITQNADGSATLTGLSRGLGFSYPFTASTTLQQSHSGQSILILSNPPQLYNQYANKANDETITGQWTFSVFPITPASPAGTETTAGIVQLATGAQAAAGTQNGTLGRLVLPTAISTSTWVSTDSNKVVVTGASNRIASSFVFGTSTTLAIPTSASSTVLMNDGNGGLTWGGVSSLASFASSTSFTATPNASTTFYSLTVPGNTLGTNNVIRITLYFSATQLSAPEFAEFAYGNATTTSIIQEPPVATPGGPAKAEFVIKELSTTASQKLFVTHNLNPLTFATSTTASGAVDSTKAQQVTVVLKNSGDQETLSFSTVEVLRQ